MGSHQCQYCTRDEARAAAEAAGIPNKLISECYDSGYRALLNFGDRAWDAPAMLPLYIALGWVPPKDFVDDVMNKSLSSSKTPPVPEQDIPDASFLEMVLAKGMTIAKPLGFLEPETTPLNRPFRISERLPEGFMAQLLAKIQSAQKISSFGAGRGS